MSAQLELTVVNKSVGTPLDHTHVLAIVATSLILMEGHVMVGQDNMQTSIVLSLVDYI